MRVQRPDGTLCRRPEHSGVVSRLFRSRRPRMRFVPLATTLLRRVVAARDRYFRVEALCRSPATTRAMVCLCVEPELLVAVCTAKTVLEIVRPRAFCVDLLELRHRSDASRILRLRCKGAVSQVRLDHPYRLHEIRWTPNVDGFVDITAMHTSHDSPPTAPTTMG